MKNIEKQSYNHITVIYDDKTREKWQNMLCAFMCNIRGFCIDLNPNMLCSPLTRRCSMAQAARSNSSLTVNPAVPPVKKASMASRRPEHLGRPGERHTNHRAQSAAQASLAPPHCPRQLRCPLPALQDSPGSGRKC